MFLRVIALDYDGTIADKGIMHPGVHEAIRKARSSGLLVVIVTGRILRELRQVTGDLDFVDGVVAENGAVILLSNGHRRMLGPPPFPVLLRELSERGIEFVVGRCLVDMDAEHSAAVLSIIRDCRLPLMISFNRNRMMVLPSSISKATGLTTMLDILGTSSHNAIGIGDAENDYDLLKCCEYGIAVNWAPRFLQDEADYVLPGDPETAVADFIGHISSNIRLPAGFSRHRSLVLESQKGAPSFEMSIRGQNILIAGDSKSGKSWIAGLFCEQLILQRYTVIAIDPEGDYSSLSTLPNTLVVEISGGVPPDNKLLSLFRQGLSLVLNLSSMDHHEKVYYIRQLLPLIARFKRNKGYPHSILIDESHYFLKENDGESILDPEAGSYILVTYRPSKLPRNILDSFEAVVATRMVDKKEIKAVQSIEKGGSAYDWYEVLQNLKQNEAAVVPPTEEAHGVVRRFSIAPRLTLHVRHRAKYFERRLSSEQAFIYTENDCPTGESASTLEELAKTSADVSPAVLAGHLERHDFSRWLLRVFDDPDLAGAVKKLEKKHLQEKLLSTFGAELFAIVKERYDPLSLTKTRKST